MRNPFRRSRGDDDGSRIPRKDRRGASPALVGLLTLVAAVVIVYFGFTKDVPFTQGYRVSAVFESANSIRTNSPVRIAGVNVGKVSAIRPYRDTNLAAVEMEISENGLPLHRDAQFKIRPRIFLEGNFFVDVSPGTPEQPELADGDTVAVTQTAGPVQLDEVLTTLQSDTREDLKVLLEEFGGALNGEASASDAGQDPAARGETAAESLNDTADDAGPALRGASIVNEAFLGTEERDLSRTIAGLQRVTAALGRDRGDLQELVENFNSTMAIFADEQADVRATLREIPPTLRTADPALASLNASFPPTRRFAREILPGVRQTAPTIDAAFPWIEQTRALVSEPELQGLARDLRPTSRDLAIATDAAISLFPQQDLLAKCFDRVLLPTGDVKIEDGPFTTGEENYKEFFYGLAGLTGEGQNFDGNGNYVRFQPGGGSQTFGFQPSTLQNSAIGSGQLFGTFAAPPVGVRPVYPGRRPPYRPDVDCFRNDLPDLNSARTGPPDSRPQGDASGGGSAPTDTPALPTLPSGLPNTAQIIGGLVGGTP